MEEWIPEGNEKIKKQIMELYEQNSKEISNLFLQFYLTTIAESETQPSASNSNEAITKNSLFISHPALMSKVAPSSVHSIAAEKVCVCYDKFISSMLNILKAIKEDNEPTKKKNEKLLSENCKLQEEIKNKDECIQTITQNYYKELTLLREQIYVQKKFGTETDVSARYFSIQEGLPEPICNLLNSRLDEVRTEMRQQIEDAAKTIRKLHQEIERFKALSPKDYHFASIPLDELCRNIKILYINNKDELWRGIYTGFGVELILEMMEKTAGNPAMLPLERLKIGLDAIRNEAIEQISSISKKDQQKIQELETKLYVVEGKLEIANKEILNANKMLECERASREKPVTKSADLLDIMLKKWKYRSLIQKFCKLNSELLSPLNRSESEKFEKIKEANIFFQQELKEANRETKRWQIEIQEMNDQIEELRQELVFSKDKCRILQEKHTELELSLSQSQAKIEENFNVKIGLDNLELLQQEFIQNGEKCRPLVQMAVMIMLKYSLISSINTLDDRIRKIITVKDQLSTPEPPKESARHIKNLSAQAFPKKKNEGWSSPQLIEPNIFPQSRSTNKLNILHNYPKLQQNSTFNANNSQYQAEINQTQIVTSLPMPNVVSDIEVQTNVNEAEKSPNISETHHEEAKVNFKSLHKKKFRKKLNQEELELEPPQYCASAGKSPLYSSSPRSINRMSSVLNIKKGAFRPQTSGSIPPHVGGFNYDKLRDSIQQSQAISHYEALNSHNSHRIFQYNPKQFLTAVYKKAKQSKEPHAFYFTPLNLTNASPAFYLSPKLSKSNAKYSKIKKSSKILKNH